ncbi:hypothetical protein WUBG_01305 [Wuchereria bancrofti]|uniref:Uncharacterized protein n=1 Tax=Wuchereria bancrofti TaxID=6293 RepID=J9FDU5_WUCBA|nr:hypothetical protein WUBG_01305 [Wuchereria bancrofti]
MANQLNTRGQPIAKKTTITFKTVKERPVSIPDKSKQLYNIADMRTVTSFL